MASNWCNYLNMWCSDIDEEERENLCPYGPDSSCRGCDEIEEIPDSKEEMRRQW